MKRISITSAMLCALLAVSLTATDAEAKRLGGGKSSGMQRESITQKAPASPAQTPTTPAKPAVQPAQAQPAAAAAAAPQKRSWLGPLAGLAAGIGLAALASHLGFGEELASFMMLALLALVAVVVIRMIMARRTPPARTQDFAYAGQSAPTAPQHENTATNQPAGNSLFQTQRDTSLGNGEVSAAESFSRPDLMNGPRHIPADFDTEGFVREAKVNFIRLQAANDAGNLDDLREVTTPEMFAEFKMEILERNGAAQETDVIAVEAEVLDVSTEGALHIISVRYSGKIREERNGPVVEFNEVWHLTKPVSGARGWLIAGIEQL